MLDKQNEASTICKVRSASHLDKPIVKNRIEASGDDLAWNTGDLDLLLHDVLEKLLVQAMARDIINEFYKPNLERMEISPLLVCSQDAIKRKKFYLTYLSCVPSRIPV